ncbi:MAG: PorT family protein [Paludibacteraceae bacterium]|nr:PorT family protein [Paludibacteraceae bacterium]
MMKRLFSFLLLGFLSINAFGQVQFLVEGGVSYTTMTINGSEYRFGGRIAGGIDMPLGDYLTFQPMLELAMKGHKESNTGVSTNPIYAEIPLKISLSFPLESEMDWRINAGPYVGYGFAGKYKIEQDGKEESYDLFGSDGRFNNLDIGLTAGTKFVFMPFYITIDAEWGLLNLNKESDQRSLKNVAYSAGIGFIF